MIIRPLDMSDREAWLPLWNGYLAFYKAGLSAAVTEKTWSEICAPGTSRGGFAAISEAGEMAGFVLYLFHPSTWSLADYCYLEDLFVAYEGRGQGTGRLLIEAVYREADRRGSERVYWITDGDNYTAQRLYDRIADKSDFIQYRRNR
jgi:GNAT superfamily N-acetyltransferase